MDRRTFLKIAGIGSLSVATGCYSDPGKKLYTLVEAPDDLIPGKAAWYASVCRECPAGCGVIAKNREGRVVKLEGNPLHPVNHGKLCMRGQAALQAIYNPDRLKTPLLRDGDEWKPVSFAEAQSLLQKKLKAAADDGENRVRMLTEIIGNTEFSVMSGLLRFLESPPPLVFEPFAYESLKTANLMTFGVDGLFACRLEDADFLLCMGADFLETWLSPVEYALKFKQMHTVKDGRKPLFFHVSPWQSLTAAAADHWISCIPGKEAAILLGCIREALAAGKGASLNPKIREAIHEASALYTAEKVAAISGIEPEYYKKLVAQMLEAQKPLVFGQGMAGDADSALQTNIAANLLNIVLDPALTLFDFNARYSLEKAARRSEILSFFDNLKDAKVVLLNNVNPVFSLPEAEKIREILEDDDRFVVSFSNFMDETSACADLIFPVKMALECWGEYSGNSHIVATLQPAMGKLADAPDLCDLLMGFDESTDKKAGNAQAAAFQTLTDAGYIGSKSDWLATIRRGGIFDIPAENATFEWKFSWDAFKALAETGKSLPEPEITFIAAPSLRFYDGRGANRPWLVEIPDPLTKVAWQSPVLASAQTLEKLGAKQGDLLEIETEAGKIKAPAYEFHAIRPGVLVMSIGQGHEKYGRYAAGQGANPLNLLPDFVHPVSGGPSFAVCSVEVEKTGKRIAVAHTDGSKSQHGRKIALSVVLHDLNHPHEKHEHGLGMNEFPLVLPLPEGYDPHRDIYPPHEHQNGYRWGMVVDLDKCIGCGACSAACYAENNLGVVGEERIIEGREMSWIRIERYIDPERPEKVTFLPMMCQHCDNAPCESVCPVYAPHHGKEGLNNQIYNRCIGTRYCSQNCPYKVRRFNWFDWQWPRPLNLQLNPDVTVRSKGVMEKCSFCVQRIKEGHNTAKDENRRVRDGEIVPACVQTCPTGAMVFGNMADRESRVRKMTDDPRAYQVMGYLNTKPAVIYLKKVVQEI